MQIALKRQDFRAMLMLPRDLQRKGVFLWQFAEMAWRRHQALEVLDHLVCLSHAVMHIYVVSSGPRDMAVAAHAVYDADVDGVFGADDWPSIVAGSNDWAREFVSTFEFSEGQSPRGRVPLFDFWAYNQADYRRLRRPF